MKMQWSLIAGLLFALLTAIFAVINVNLVEVNLMFNVVHIPLIVLILGCTLIGGIIVGSYGIFRQYKLQKQVKRLTQQLAQAEIIPDFEPTNLNKPKEAEPFVDPTDPTK
ncbi:MAG TPA: lipopolysaccharide assembly protein LapA domain-containing protein [Paenibacillus sp.]|jgi:uncharacterized integral membrane protein